MDSREGQSGIRTLRVDRHSINHPLVHHRRTLPITKREAIRLDSYSPKEKVGSRAALRRMRQMYGDVMSPAEFKEVIEPE